ncbi:hypothetical protein F442_12806 [Phytophthora nicotianae P10297]|uniref:Uncharacterized protein n=2 Tax=Phytophthora nicotianae TaxID=4792 RepID=W2YY88_PHYNI|nr:hypothetical protein F444_13013 [Phytophthora nicotianae P1976]ETP39750.1 hypothetical protein F442_12806 [Phytophthora nicotianae P10297]
MHPLHGLEFTYDTQNADPVLDSPTAILLMETADIDEFLKGISTAQPTSSRNWINSTTDQCQGNSHQLKEHSGNTNQKAKRGNRLTTKNQIIELKDMVKELTSQLDVLEAAQRGNNSSQGKAPTLPSSASLWKKIAAKQLGRRQKAEKNNAQLRAMVQVVLEESQGLKRILKQRKRMEWIKRFISEKRPRNSMEDDYRTDPAYDS